LSADAARGTRRDEVVPLESVEPIGHTSKPDHGLVSLVAPGLFAADQYEALRHFVERQAETSGHKVMAVTSPTPGDGKTLTSINLAGALARGVGAQVLLVDGDLRRPAVFSQLGLDDSSCPKGLTQIALDGSLALREVVRYCPEHRLFLLSTGEPASTPYDVLGAPAMGRFFEEARRHFHFVIVDTPPAVGFSDFRLLERWADGSLLVVSEGITPRKMLELALDIVDPKKARGIVLNHADVKAVSRYYDSYYRQRQPRGPS
jgi:capsular exopolysaccharide synthesis family protein